MTEGHDYLMKHFGVRPRIAWQIDPFGHSSITPTFAALFGFDALVINRIHHNLKVWCVNFYHLICCHFPPFALLTPHLPPEPFSGDSPDGVCVARITHP